MFKNLFRPRRSNKENEDREQQQQQQQHHHHHHHHQQQQQFSASEFVRIFRFESSPLIFRKNDKIEKSLSIYILSLIHKWNLKIN